MEQANQILLSENASIPLCFLQGDLEWTMFSGLSEESCQEIAQSIGVTYDNKPGFIKRMGSKAIDGNGLKTHKASYLRRQVAESIPFSEISSNVSNILAVWLTNGGFTPQETEDLMQELSE
ncbi:MAG: hypothetical protein OXI64_12630 [Defluviicoccus sp.]|nr:hypothetical protein [Defluviicoccus sp.]